MDDNYEVLREKTPERADEAFESLSRWTEMERPPVTTDTVLYRARVDSMETRGGTTVTKREDDGIKVQAGNESTFATITDVEVIGREVIETRSLDEFSIRR